MKQFFFIISLLISFTAFSQEDEYYRQVDWKFYPDSIVQLTDSTYQLVANPFDYNDPGAINRTVGNYVVDFVGHRYLVIDSTSTKLTVKDIYSTGQAPQTGQIARCYKSAYYGEADFVGSVDYSPLDESAKWKLNGADNELIWRSFIRYPYVGVINEPTITKNIDGTITIGSNGDYVFNTQTDGKGRNVRFDNVTGTTLNVTDNAVSYVYVDYNNGSPFYTFVSDNTLFFWDFTKLPVVRVTRLGTQSHFEEPGEFAVQLANKIMYKNVAVNPFQRQSGLTLSTAATRISTISSGVAWFAIKYYNLTGNVAGAAGNLYEYYLSAGNWVKSLVTSYDADYYSDGTDRQTLNNNKWVAKYFYRDVGDDNEAYYIHGNQYNTQAEALAETLPFAPNIITAHSIYVGKIVIQKGATNGTAYPRQWEGAIQSATSSNHADLTNLGWTVSNHTDGANKIAAFGASGEPVVLDTITNLASQHDLISKVTGPSTSTDNAIARYDGTTGKIIQNSGVTIDDNNRIYSKEILINKSNFPSNEVDGIYVSATYSGSENVIRGIKTESHYSGTYAQTGLESSSYIEGSNNQNHANAIQSWLYNTSSGTTTYASNYYASKTLTSGTITDAYGYLYNSGTLGSATIGNDYAFYSRGNNVSLFEGGLIISPTKLSTTNRRQRLSSYDDTNKTAAGILTAGIGVYSTRAAAANNIGAIAFGSARTGLLSSYYENAFIAGGNDAANQYGGYLQFNTTSSGGGGEIASGNYERMRIASTGNILINTTTDNLVDKLQVNGSILGTTAKLINLSDGYIPYHVSDASGLANSIIRQTTGAIMTLNGTTTGGWYINGGNATGTGGGYTLYQTDATNKFFVGTETSAIGGTSGGGIAYVYGNFPFKVYTNNVNRLTIDATGATFTGFVQGTTGKFTNLTDNYIPKHTSDATGLENSNIFFSGNIARYGTANTFSNDRDIPDKAYVDAIAAGNMPKLPVDAATTGNITLSGTQTIDGYSAGVGARILVWKQTTTSQNGVYIVASGSWTRATDLDTWAELYKAYVTVLNGAQSGSSFVCTVPSTGTLGTDPVTWILYNAPTNITVSAPLAKSGNNLSLGYDTNTLDVASNLLKVKDNVFQPILNGTGFVKVSGTTVSYDNSTYLTAETDPVFAADSANLLHWSDTLNTTKGIATPYDLTTGLATKQNILTTGNLTENITGLQFDNIRQVIGGAAELSLTSGYSIPTTANQTNWTAGYNDKINSLAFTGTTTKTLTLTQQDGGTVSNTFTDLDIQTLTADSTTTTIGLTASGSNSRIHFNVDKSATNEIQNLSLGTVTTTTQPLNISSGTGVTLPAATTSTAGLLTSADKTKLDGIATGANNYSLPLAANGTRGGIQIGYTATGANLPLQLSSEKGYVGLTNSAIVAGLGYTPYNATNPNGYTSNTGTVTSIVTGLGLSGGTITTTGTISLDTANVNVLSRQRAANTYQPKGTYQTGTESYISNLALSGNTLTSTGVGSAFNSTVGNIANISSANIFTQDQTIAKASGVSALKIKDSGVNIFGSLDADNGYFYVRNGKPYFINGDFGSTEIDLTPSSVSYPPAGIAVSTGSAWGTSITDNSANWNTAYNDKVNLLNVTGTTTKTITLTQQDGGTVTGNFTDNDTYTSLVSNGGLGVSGSSLYLSNINASGTAPLLTDYMWASPSSSTTVKSFTLQTLKDLIGTSYTLPLAANGTRGGIQIGYTSTANNFALQLSSEKAYTALPDATTSVKGIASFNSGNFTVSSGAVSVATGGIGAMNLANSVISGQVDIGSDIVDTDEFLISDGGTLRRTDASRLKTYIGGETSGWTDSGTLIYPTTSTDKVVIGRQTTAGNTMLYVESPNTTNYVSIGANAPGTNSYGIYGYATGTNAIGIIGNTGNASAIGGYFANNYPDGTALKVEGIKKSLYAIGPIALLESSSSPSTPDGNDGYLYAKTDAKIYYKNDAGIEYDLTNVNEPLRTISATGTTQLSATDKIILVTATGVTITYPTVTSGKVYTIRNTTSSAITVPSYNVLGPAASTSVAAYGCITVVYNGTTWYQLD